MFSEVKAVYKQYVNAIFCSHSKEEIEYKDGFFGSGKNLVLKELSEFSIIIICKYIDKNYLDEVFKDHSISKITLSSKAENKLYEILENFLLTIDNKLLEIYTKERILVVLKILELSTVSEERMICIFNLLYKVISIGIFRNTDFRDISNFIARTYNKDKSAIKSDSLIQIINSICSGFKLNMWIDTDDSYLHTLFENTTYILSDLFPQVVISNSYSEAILENDKVDFLASLFTVASDDLKEKIRSQVVVKLNEQVFNYKLYYDAIQKNIITESECMEDRLFNRVNQIFSEQDPSIRSYPNPLEVILTYCLNIHLNGKLVHPERLVPYLKDFPEIEFLYDMDNFDYSKFDLAWFTNSYTELKGEIIKNETAYKEIKKIFKNAIERNGYNRNFVSEYFKYFDKD